MRLKSVVVNRPSGEEGVLGGGFTIMPSMWNSMAASRRRIRGGGHARAVSAWAGGVRLVIARNWYCRSPPLQSGFGFGVEPYGTFSVVRSPRLRDGVVSLA